MGHKVFCILCRRSEETKITGPLSTKEGVTAHQNCLLYSSGIYCTESPQEDDLFGFSVDDVKDEVTRGRKLKCSKCTKRGATAGCENRRCKKSYHYPCAVEVGAKIVEEKDKGEYGLFCPKHLKSQENNGPVNGHTSTHTKHAAPRNPSEAGPSKVYCLTCERKEGKISLDSLSTNIMLYCDKHAPSSHKITNGDYATAGPSRYRTESNSSGGNSSKRLFSSDDDEEVRAPTRKAKRIIIEDSLTIDEILPSDMEIFAPIESSQFDESVNSAQDCETVPQLTRNDTESHTGSGSGHQLQDESRDDDDDEDDEDDEDDDEDEGKDETSIDSDAESESLLLPVEICVESQSQSLTATTPEPYSLTETSPVETGQREFSHEQSPAHSPDRQTAEPSVPLQSHTVSPAPPDGSKPDNATTSPPHPRSAISPVPPEPIYISLVSPTPSPGAPTSNPEPNPEPNIDSASFWKSCNAAGCTQAIFTDFIKELNDMSDRIESDQASQNDYDCALKVMSSSGKLEKLVTKQQKELQRKKMELEKAAAAMSEAVSALKR
ncbi:eisosome protein SEG2 isoform X2 [Notolabrus celidotus]|uniref:eisosome protein SEG2 isoform X2 n=1 Tax=Notolabrus celidotus TaxID=1203425 RepID=UPI0014900413|nr:eisosome protein SEG2 isoform X2 [Notolabrus celidotus]